METDVFDSAEEGDSDNSDDSDDSQAPLPNPEPQEIRVVAKLGWIIATHVCKRWRDQVLRSPELWTDITFTLGIQWAAEMVARSHPLPVRFALRRGPSSPVSPEVADQQAFLLYVTLPRIRILVLEAFEHARFVQALQRPAPLLEAVQLQLIGSTGDPPELFSGQVPNLRRAMIRSFDFSWRFLLGAQLTHLSVDTDVYFPKHNPSYDKLFNVLEEMRTLVSLQLDDLEPTLARPHSARVVDLPNLRWLFICAELAPSMYVIEHLKIPATCKVGLRSAADKHPGMNREFLDYLLVLRNFVQREPYSHPPLESLVIRMGKKHDLWFSARRARMVNTFNIRLSATRREKGPDFDAIWQVFSDADASPSTVSCLRDICITVLPLSSLRVLRLTVVPTVQLNSSFHWQDVFGHCTEIEYLRITESPELVEAFLNCIANEYRGPGDMMDDSSATALPTVRHILFPKLVQLSLRKVNLTGTLAEHDIEAMEWRCLHTRFKAVEIHECVMGMGDLEMWRTITPLQVDWDGKLCSDRQ